MVRQRANGESEDEGDGKHDPDEAQRWACAVEDRSKLRAEDEQPAGNAGGQEGRVQRGPRDSRYVRARKSSQAARAFLYEGQNETKAEAYEA
jgi:hypothetical protein